MANFSKYFVFYKRNGVQEPAADSMIPPFRIEQLYEKFT